MTREPIAIVGLGGVLPDAATLDDFWNVVERGIDTASEPPPDRWPLDLDLAYHPDRARADRVYSRRACFVRDFRLDPTGLDLPPDLLDALDPMVHLALHAGRQAWQDTVTKPLDPGRVGVMLGNIVLPTTSASAMADWILGRRFERELFRAAGVPMPPETRSPVNAVNRWVASLPAAMLARALGLGGERLCLDAACASSLFAVQLAIDALRSGRLDAVLAGGLSRPDSLYTQMGFSQLLAVSPTGRCSPFDHKADGLVVGEGAGVLVLKRRSDALAHGDRIRALVHSVGLSNDVEGSLLAPSREGQLRAMTGVYRAAGWRPSDVDLVECHATGTPVGDAVEFASLQKLWEGEDAPPGACVIGSVKSNTGHLLTGAGAVGLLKTVLALEHGVLPPTANFEQPGDNVDLDGGPFRVLQRAEPWPSPTGHARRAAVSGFGFGGTNAHVLMEEAVEPSSTAISVSVPEQVREQLPLADVAIVGLGARIGPWRDLDAVRQRMFGRGEDHTARPKRNHWGIPDAALGWFIEELEIPFGRFKIPPREIEEALPQQMLMLQVAERAIADAHLDDVERLRTGVFVGVELDLNTTNYHLRWSVRARAADWARRLRRATEGEEFEHWVDGLCDAIAPALNANRTIGGLGSIVASRVAREFGLGGPSYVLSSEETSGLTALRAATRALQRGRLECAVVGAVDLSGDVRSLLSLSSTEGISAEGVPRPFEAGADGIVPSDGAVALVLKREPDARRDGDRIYAIVRGFGSAAGDLEQTCGQAILRGCEDAGVSPHELDYVESHGSGVERHDRLEAAALGKTLAADTVIGCSKARVGHAGAAAGMVSVLGAALSLYHQLLPPAVPSGPGSRSPRLTRLTEPHPWLRDRIDGPRRAGVLALARSGDCAHVVLEGSDHGPREDDSAQPLGPMAEGLFVVEADDADGLTAGLRNLLAFASRAEDRPAAWLTEDWWRERPLRPEAPLAVALVARTAVELENLSRAAADQLERGEDPSERSVGRLFFARQPLGPGAGLAFVYPGSGSQFNGMGRETCLQWPGVVREQDRTNERLRSQLEADSIWRGEAALTDARTVILSQVALGTMATDLMTGFGVRPDAVVGYSLGETAGLFSLGAWHERDEMLRRTTESNLFVSSLTGECSAARRAWGLAEDAELNWLAGVVDRPADRVREALEGRERVYLLIVNTPDECVIGGDAAAVEEAVDALGAAFHALQGVPTVHCEVAREVEDEYRDLHLLDTRTPEGVRFYSGASGEAYDVDREKAADSLLAQAIHGVDFPKTVRQAHDDGVRIFLEMGPGSSCTRMIQKILEGRAFRARSISSPTRDEPSTVLRALAMLIAERVPIDLGPLYRDMAATEEESGPAICVPVGQEGFGSIAELMPAETPSHATDVPAALPHGAPDLGIASHAGTLDLDGVPTELAAALQTAETTVQAHETYLRASQRTQELGALQIAHQQELIRAMAPGGAVVAVPAHSAAAPGDLDTTHAADPTAVNPVVLDRDQLMEFAVGSIGGVLGAAFAEVDAHPTRVRLPDEPLMLVDRVTAIEGEPQSMTSGRIVTEHDVLQGAWYLDGGRIPTCIAVEAGQADLLLSGYLGIDSETNGLAVYRLLDAVVTFHSELAVPGETIVYDIRILRFFRQGDTWLFRFQFDATVDGRLLMTMREGSAGFFTQAELDAGKGIVQSSMEQRPRAGTRPSDWRDLVPLGKESYAAERLAALRAGDLAKAFGDEFAGLDVERPLTIPGGRMRLVHRVTELDPEGGRYGMGSIVAEADIHPDDWFITCHFVDDEVMPGTLMYECCMHTLRIFLLRMGWVADEDTATWQPIVEVKSRLRCRGQVLASTRVVTYEIDVRELGYGPEPYAVADALMYSDGKPIVELRDMSVRLTGASREGLETMWSRRGAVPGVKTLPYDKASILAFSSGKPSEAYGDPYRIFDEGARRIARLPRPPYQFLDRIMSVAGEPFVMRAGARARAQFDVSPEHWYFASNRQHEIPFAVLLEVALQPCGWLAAYVGSALTSEGNLRFRNLGGDAVQLDRMTAGSDVITTDVELTDVSTSGGMIIQRYHMALEGERAGRLYEGTTYFGFFSDQALADQVGLRDALIHQASPAELEHGASFPVPLTRPFPDRRLRMVDNIELLAPDGGPDGLGWIHGSIAVDADAWFFKAHFYQDPVWPGSLGLEAFLQLLKVYAARRWSLGEQAQFTSMPAEHNHRWSYRGQIVPGCEAVEVFASITAVDDEQQSLVADGFLVVDGRTIYSMNDFSLEARE
jgi:acyl transferase domain-containing protein/3-hydroxymyristoyl/3-hydroxydecanoyl-(acyl carrier protein) dehydratase